ncbi:MAG: adenine deaminase [Candidatus Eisenbacteria bacterium]|nr:adenine deaminase [Candidatus Eisenbacteria bacterium]
MKELAKIIRAARGKMPPDLVLKNGRIVNVFSAEVYKADLAVWGGRIVGIGPSYKGRKAIDLKGAFVLPGLIDGHMHVESTMVKVQEFARSVVPRGTTSVICDPHEIANVHGLEGIHYILNSSKFSPVNIFVMLSSCVPATPFETSGANLRGFDLYPLLREKWVLGLGEVMNYPGVLLEDEGLLDKISMTQDKRIDGHAPGLSGRDLNAYVAAGVNSDHESTSVDEVVEKLRLGMHIMIREGSVTKNLRDLLPAVTTENLSRCFFVTDDRHPKDLLRKGHVDHMVKMAVKEGLDPVSAIRLATINTAQYFRLKDLGAIAPGYFADLVVVDDLRKFNVRMVFKNGRLVAKDGEMVVARPRTPQITLRSSINIRWLKVEDFEIPASGHSVRVINLVPDQIVTRASVEHAKVEDGKLVADLERDLLPLAVVERHLASGNVGRAVVRGFGLRKGALASSVSHDSHNVAVVGTSPEEMMAAVIEISKMRGGLAVVRDGKLVVGLPLPIAGLMSEKTLPEVVEGLDKVTKAARRLGSKLDDPFMALSFLALPVIPELKITDRGLFDVNAFAFTDLFV